MQITSRAKLNEFAAFSSRSSHPRRRAWRLYYFSLPPSAKEVGSDTDSHFYMNYTKLRVIVEKEIMPAKYAKGHEK
jgi:glucose-6-phosphate 1-dehydrogenase